MYIFSYIWEYLVALIFKFRDTETKNLEIFLN